MAIIDEYSGEARGGGAKCGKACKVVRFTGNHEGRECHHRVLYCVKGTKGVLGHLEVFGLKLEDKG